MDEGMVEALCEEAEGVRRAPWLSDDERFERLGLIRAQVIAFGGDGKLVDVPKRAVDKPKRDSTKRVTRQSKQAQKRRRS
jgi:hypothetical protein